MRGFITLATRLDRRLRLTDWSHPLPECIW